MDLLQTLEALCGVNAPSGFEAPAARLAAELLSPLVDEVWTDPLGSVIGVRRCGRPEAAKLLLDAHLDEIGLLVTGVEEGFLRFCAVGGVDPRMLPGREVVILTEPPIPGVVACLPPHVQKKGDADRAMPLSELFVDVGLSQAAAEARVPLGTPMVFRGGCTPLSHGKLCGKALDDRSCFAALLRCAELLQDRPLDVDLYIMGSTREEVSGAGARCAAFSIAPDFCVAVDVTHGNTPDAKDKGFDLGSGAAIGVGPNMTRWMTRRLVRRAEERKIPYTLEVMGGDTGTNAWPMQVSREGIATAVVSLPLRYMHSPIEVLERSDVEQVAQLLAAFVEGLGEEAEYPCCN